MTNVTVSPSPTAVTVAPTTTAVTVGLDDSTHAVRTDNPHSVTAAQVGNTTAQWNADQLQGVNVHTTAPTDDQFLRYNLANSRWEAETVSIGGAPGGATTQVQFNDAGAFNGSANFTWASNKLSITGDINVSGGLSYLDADTGGLENTFLGETGNTVNSGSYNVFIGSEAGKVNTTGGQNIGIGRWALQDNTTGIENVAIGLSALLNNTSGESNFGLGKNALVNCTVTDDNVAIGSEVMKAATFSTLANGRAIAIGTQAMLIATDPRNSLAIGFQAGYQCGTGNIMLGYQAGFSETGNNKLYIENSNSTTPLVYGDFSSELIRINGDLEWTGIAKLEANVSTDTAPNDDTSTKKLTLQKLASPPTNAAYITFTNNPGTDNFYLVLEEG